MAVEGLKTCTHCGETVTGNRKVCDKAACQRKAASARTAKSRQRKKEQIEALVEAEPALVTPWGTEVDCPCVAWGEAFVLSGYGADPDEARAWLAEQGYDGHAPNDARHSIIRSKQV